MSLKDAKIEDTYFLNKIQPYYFYNELYKHANDITIALGYFSRTAFCIGTEELLNFIENNDGKLHFICNDKLFFDDADAIENGYRLKETSSITLDDLKKLFEQDGEDKDFKIFSFKCLSYLIALDRLDIAIAKSDKLVHFKVGYAIDNENNTVAFSGSINYTLSALLLNYEQLTTFCSWKKPVLQSRIDEIVNPIKDLYKENIYELPLIKGKDIADYIRETYPVNNLEELHREYEILKKRIIKNGRKIKIIETSHDFQLFFNFPDKIKPRKHQDKAISNWEENNYQSLFAMATGTGKTLTALFAINDFNFEHEISALLIIVPLIDLVSQWEKDIEKYLAKEAFIIKISSKDSWRNTLDNYKIYKNTIHFSKDKIKPAIIIVTYDSYAINSKTILDSLDLEKTIIIADEVHNFGAETNRKLLSENIKYRIGLSATYKRAFDEDGTKAIVDYFCPSERIFTFTINDAINAGMLCKYNYYPVLVPLTDEEMEKYEEISAKIARLTAINENDEKASKDNQDLTLLMKARHRIIEKAENKEDSFVHEFIKVIEKEPRINNTIVFCPEGKVDNEDVLTSYQKLIWDTMQKRNLYPKMAKYVQNTPKTVLEDFEKQKIDIILAKQRLNEGIDIPSVKRAFFISSSTSEREFVQRRGRILRLYDKKEMAEIYDFIVIPASKDSQYGNSILKSESSRVVEFAEAAENFHELTEILSIFSEEK